jgi:hypothetical protein
VNSSVPLFFEYAAELCYPVSESVSAGLLTNAQNLACLIFLVVRFPVDVGNAVMLVLSVCSFLAMLLVEEKYRRSSKDRGIVVAEVAE